MDKEFNIAKYNYKEQCRQKRYEKRVECSNLICQECGGAGYYDEYPAGIWLGSMRIPCDWCMGTGKQTPWLRGQWLKYKRLEKQYYINQFKTKQRQQGLPPECGEEE